MGTHRFRLFIGTYTKTTSQGIYGLALDARTGELGELSLAARAPNPTFLALSPDASTLYAVCAGEAWASSFRVGRGGESLTALQQGEAGSGPTPCHIAVGPSGTVALAANYHLGLAAAITLGPQGAMGPVSVVSHTGRGPHPTRQDQAHVHSTNISPDGRFALVCDLGLDRIYTYRIGREPASLSPAATPYIATAPGAGPRHLAFGKSGRSAYAINELDNTIVVYDYDEDGGTLFARQTVTVLPPGYAGNATAAEVRVHPSGRWLYGSVRGPDTLASFEVDPSTGFLSPLESVPCGGRGPRNFALSPDGAWLVCAHQDSDSVCSFQVDPQSGRLRRAAGTVTVPMPVCVLFTPPSAGS